MSQIKKDIKMKKSILFTLLISLLFIGCSKNDEALQNVEAKLVVGKSLANMQLQDQNEELESISPTTTTLFFSFAKETGHFCNEFLEAKPTNFLEKHHAFYIADVSPAPTLIKNMFILPDLKKLPFKILLINDDKLSAAYSKNINKDKIIVVHLVSGKISKIETLESKEDLEKFFS